MRHLRNILLALLTTLVVLVGAVVLVLKHPRVRAYAVGELTARLSERLGTRVDVAELDFHFPARVSLRGVYVEDLNRDTLAYVDMLYAHFSPAALFRHTLRFPMVELEGVRTHIYRDDSVYNYRFLADAFAQPKDSSEHKPFDWNVEVEHLALCDVRGYFDTHVFGMDSLSLSVPHFSLDSVRSELDIVGLEYTNPRLSVYDRTRIDHARISVLLNDSVWTLPRLQVEMPRSALDASGVRVDWPRTDTIDFRQQAHDISLHLHVNHAHFTPADIAGVVPRFRHLTEQLCLTTDLDGTLDSLDLSSLRLSYAGRSVLNGDMCVTGLPSLETAEVRAECRDLCVRLNMVEEWVSALSGKSFRLPKEVHRLGEVHYRGLLHGRIENLHLHGAFSTQLGAISTFGALHADTAFRNLDFQGRVGSRRFHLGTMLGQPSLGTLDFDLSTSGAKRDSLPLMLDFKADVSAPMLTTDLLAEGHLGEHNHLEVSARVDSLSPGEWASEPVVAAYGDAVVRLLLAANLDWTDMDDISGLLTVDSFSLARPLLEDTLDFREPVELRMENGRGNYRRILLTSPVFTGRVEGKFEFSTLPTTLLKFAAQHLPGLVDVEGVREKIHRSSNNQLDIYLYGHRLQKLQYMLDLPARVGDYPVLKAYVDESRKMWGLQGYVSNVNTSRLRITDITLSADNQFDACHVDLSTLWAGTNYRLHTVARGDSVSLDLVGTTDTAAIRGDVHLVTKVLRYRNRPFFSVSIAPSNVYAGDSLFRIAPSLLTYSVADTMLTVDHFRVGTGTQFIQASGAVSPRATDSLSVYLGRIDPSMILPLVLPEQTLTAGGSLSGRAVLYNVFTRPEFTVDVRLGDALLNGSLLGDVYARLFLADDRSHMVIDGDVYSTYDADRFSRTGRSRLGHVDGYVDMVKHDGSWGIDIVTDSIGLGFVQHWVGETLTGIGGTVSGNVRVSGSRGKTYVVAAALPHNGHLTIPYTGCTYYLNDSCFLDSTGIYFPHLTLRDEEGNPLYFDGALRHQLFQNFTFDMSVHMDHALALNLPYKAGELMQGKVYARGDVRILGDDRLIRLTANARAVGDSRFRMSIDGASNASSSDFVTWVDHNAVQRLASEEKDYGIRKWVNPAFQRNGKLPTRFVMEMGIDADPELTFQLMLNDKTGDMIQARGDAAIRLSYDANTQDFRMAGAYTVQSGKMGFTLANAFRRDFTIAEGSTISWTSDPVSPTLNITAKYHVTASLKDLFGEESTNLSTTSRTSIPVNTCVHLTGPLSGPMIRFSLEFPMSEDAIQQQVRSVINTDEMMMRQVINLIVFGRFYTPENLNKTTGVGINETYSLVSSTITGQINNWLSKLTDIFTFGIDIRTDGMGAESSQEYEANFQLTPVQRLIINGNFGYRYNDVTNRPFFGDLDVEYMLTPNGKLRARAYTHTVDKYSLRQASMIEGVGLVFKHSFNWGDSRRAREARRAAKEREAASLPDSTRTDTIDFAKPSTITNNIKQ